MNCERYSELNKRGVKCRRGKGLEKAKEKQNKGKKEITEKGNVK